MVWFCATGCHKIRENSVPVTKKMDFRKADPTYVNFVPTTAADAINKFYRHKSLGVPPHLWPEVFVECAASLSALEMAKFESWLVNPAGEPTGADLKQIDAENETLRRKLLKEAQGREADASRIPEMKVDETYMAVGDEKSPPEESVEEVSSMMVNLSHDTDFDMVTPLDR